MFRFGQTRYDETRRLRTRIRRIGLVMLAVVQFHVAAMLLFAASLVILSGHELERLQIHGVAWRICWVVVRLILVAGLIVTAVGYLRRSYRWGYWAGRILATSAFVEAIASVIVYPIVQGYSVWGYVSFYFPVWSVFWWAGVWVMLRFVFGPACFQRDDVGRQVELVKRSRSPVMVICAYVAGVWAGLCIGFHFAIGPTILMNVILVGTAVLLASIGCVLGLVGVGLSGRRLFAGGAVTLNVLVLVYVFSGMIGKIPAGYGP